MPPWFLLLDEEDLDGIASLRQPGPEEGLSHIRHPWRRPTPADFADLGEPEGTPVRLKLATPPRSLDSVRRKIDGEILSQAELSDVMRDIAAHVRQCIDEGTWQPRTEDYGHIQGLPEVPRPPSARR